MVPGNLLFNYLSFLKTRLVLVFVSKHMTFVYIILRICIEIISIGLLHILSTALSLVIAHLLIPKYLENAIVTLVAQTNTITATLSTIIVILFVAATIMSYCEIAPEPTGHGLPLSKCEAYNRVYDQRSRSS